MNVETFEVKSEADLTNAERQMRAANGGKLWVRVPKDYVQKTPRSEMDILALQVAQAKRDRKAAERLLEQRNAADGES